MTDTARLVVVAISFAIVGASVAGLASRVAVGPGASASSAPQTRDFFLEIVPQDIDMGGGMVWHAWTFNHTVPGPTLVATVGDHVRVTVHNAMNVTHSFHTHLSPYGLENDGSQLNVITGIGGMAMIPPNGTYTYEFTATVAGLFYYHCHSADGGHTIHEHMAQGLYGAIIVKAPGEAPIDDEVVFMAERGFDVSDPRAPYYVMNGKGIPGGEHALETIFAQQGVPGVVAQLGKTVPTLHGRVGVPMRINVVNIGDVVHSFHLHAMTAYMDDGKPLPAQVLGLLPGEANRVTVTPTEPGLWLFHCHVVSHADGGMIGVFIVEPREGSLQLPQGNATPPPGMPGMGGSPAPSGSPPAQGDVTVTASTGEAGELSFSPSLVAVAQPGMLHVTFVNGGHVPHTFSIPSLGVDTGEVPPGASATVMATLPAAGDYAFQCSVPGHAEGGMRGTIRVGGASA